MVMNPREMLVSMDSIHESVFEMKFYWYEMDKPTRQTGRVK